MTVKEQIVELARKKEFKSVMFTDTEWLYSTKEDMRFYLWLHEFRLFLALQEAREPPDFKKFNDELAGTLIKCIKNGKQEDNTK